VSDPDDVDEGGGSVSILQAFLRPRRTVHAHCDLPCGVYDPAQARIEAESVKACQEKYQGSDDPVFRERAVTIKEQRATMVKEHLWVLWTDYFKPEHVEKYPDLHEKFWTATKLAGDAKKSLDPAQGQQLLDAIDELSKIFWETKS
jgi:nickel superoxide dismutase